MGIINIQYTDSNPKIKCQNEFHPSVNNGLDFVKYFFIIIYYNLKIIINNKIIIIVYFISYILISVVKSILSSPE